MTATGKAFVIDRKGEPRNGAPCDPAARFRVRLVGVVGDGDYLDCVTDAKVAGDDSPAVECDSAGEVAADATQYVEILVTRVWVNRRDDAAGTQ